MLDAIFLMILACSPTKGINFQLFALLLEAGADPARSAPNGASFFSCATHFIQDTKTAQNLLSPLLQLQQKSLNTIMFTVSCACNPHLTEYLLKSNLIDLDYRMYKENNYTFLHNNRSFKML